MTTLYWNNFSYIGNSSYEFLKILTSNENFRKKNITEEIIYQTSIFINEISTLYSNNFLEVNQKAQELADIIENLFDKLADILSDYESYEVIKDETRRTLDLLRNIKKNNKYFRLRVGAIATFLPRNQPLYAFCCFVLILSLMASEVHFLYSICHAPFLWGVNEGKIINLLKNV